MKKGVVSKAGFIVVHPILCSIFSVLAYTFFYAFSMWKGGEFYFLDTDCYTRYLRIIDWLSGDFSWFEKIFPFTNCPEGEILHFTRLNDVIWLIFSLPFVIFLPLKSALFAGGLIFSPLFLVCTLALILCGLKKFVDERDFQKPALFIFIFAFIFLTKTMVFEFGRPDHHSLMLVIATFLIINLLNFSARKMFLCGICAALGIWASSAPEGMLLAFAFLAVLVIGEIFYAQSFMFAYRYTFGLFLGTALAYVLNPPFEGYLYFDNARLSLIHVIICALAFISFAIAKKIRPQGLQKRFMFLFFATMISFLILVFLFSKEVIFAPIYDEKIAAYFVPHIAEMKPILLQEVWYLIFGALEILWLYFVFKCKNFRYASLYIMFFIYLPFAVCVRRFLAYEILFYVLINSLILVELFKRISENEICKWATLIYIFLNVAFSISFSYNVSPKRAAYPKLQGCALTDIFFAPQLIYKTGISSIGSPYHRNIAGIADTVEIFSATDEIIIQKHLKKRGVKYVIIPTEPLEYLQNAPDNSFYKSLLRGREYDWLTKINADDNTYIFLELKN